jgi:hypothetical protein
MLCISGHVSMSALHRDFQVVQRVCDIADNGGDPVDFVHQRAQCPRGDPEVARLLDAVGGEFAYTAAVEPVGECARPKERRQPESCRPGSFAVFACGTYAVRAEIASAAPKTGKVKIRVLIYLAAADLPKMGAYLTREGFYNDPR